VSIRRPQLHCGARLCLLVVALGVSTQAAAQSDTAAPITVNSTSGSVVFQPAGGEAAQLGGDALATGAGDVLLAGDDGQATLSEGPTLNARVFHDTKARVQDNSYELLYGTTLNTVAADAPLAVATPGAVASTQSGTFLLYYDPGATTTWVIVTDGTATVSTTTGSIDIPAGFLTSAVDGSNPLDPQPANRATLGSAVPSVDDLTGGALADGDILAAPAPVDVAGASAAPPPADTAFAAGPGDTAVQPALSDLGGLVPFPTTATLRAGQTTVWYWPRRQGDLDTVEQDDTRTVIAGDGVNVNDSGRAELSFGDFNVQIFRHGQLQMIPTADPNGYGLGYDLLQGATLNTVSANTLQSLSNDRIGVRAGWAVVTAIYTAHPTASTDQLAAAAPGDAQFVVESDGSSTWVVVTEGAVHVEPVRATPGSIPAGAQPAAPVVVNAGSQTWVDPGQPPAPPVPATRAAVGGKFPTLEDLTNGELTDNQVLAGSKVAPIPTSTPQSVQVPSATPNQGTCYRFTSTPIGGATYALTMRYASLPAASVTYWNPPANTWFYAKYQSAQPAQRPTVTLSMNGADIQTLQSADSLIDLSNGAKQSFMNFHFNDTQLDTAVSLTGAADVVKSPALGASLPPLLAFTKTQFYYKPAGTGRVAGISTC
jgi:ferric-dicitrate binding protein FerR (iron transport regulator)